MMLEFLEKQKKVNDDQALYDELEDEIIQYMESNEIYRQTSEATFAEICEAEPDEEGMCTLQELPVMVAWIYLHAYRAGFNAAVKCIAEEL